MIRLTSNFFWLLMVHALDVYPFMLTSDLALSEKGS